MKCYYRDRECIVSDDDWDSTMCLACARFESNDMSAKQNEFMAKIQEAMGKAAEGQAKMADAMVPKEIEKKPDEKKDVQ